MDHLPHGNLAEISVHMRHSPYSQVSYSLVRDMQNCHIYKYTSKSLQTSVLQERTDTLMEEKDWEDGILQCSLGGLAQGKKLGD